jgi:hypothetical protein
VFSLMNFIVNNQEYYQTNSAVHSVDTNKNWLHTPVTSLSCIQKSAYYFGIRILNCLPSNLTSLVNKKVQFIVTVKRY